MISVVPPNQTTSKSIHPSPLTAKKRKLFEKAQLKRRYAKLLKKEGMTTTSPPSHELEATKDDPEIGSSISTSTPVVANKIRRGGAEDRSRHQGGCDEKTHRDRGQEVDGAGNTKPGGKGKPLQQHQQQQHQQHRPDPFKKAKVNIYPS